MDLLASYGGSDDEEGQQQQGPSKQREESPVREDNLFALTLPQAVSAAPEVDTAGFALKEQKAVASGSTRHLLDPKARTTQYNLPYQDLAAPLMGPAHPFQKDGLAAGMKNHRTGHVEDSHMHSYAFDEQYNTFHSFGVAIAPGGTGVVHNKEFVDEDSVYGNAAKRRRTTAEKKEAAARKAALEQQAAQEAAAGAPYSITNPLPWADKEVKTSELTEEQKEYLARLEAGKEAAAAQDVGSKGPSALFHGKEAKDYQGRAWLEPPRDLKKESDYCYLPKKWIHSWTGHTKGVNAIRFFPDTGHLLLSAGLDGAVKIWNVNGNRKCMCTYMGHTKGVRDINFTKDGRRFVSVGYDKLIRLWDTETGKVLQTINNGKLYYCGVFHPDADKQNVLMAGCADKKIYQFDLDTGDSMQEYNYHLGAVNSVTFFDDGRRFVSSSDDKTLRVWEFGIPVQIKYVADPSMHSMPSITPHPNGQYLIAQSLDNQVLTYSVKEGRFKQNRKKTFKGHNTAGYACQVGFSPDARFVLSGDSEGRAFFWDWSHPYKIVRTIKAHDGVCIGVAWNPMESSKVATCGWDGVIKYWD